MNTEKRFLALLCAGLLTALIFLGWIFSAFGSGDAALPLHGAVSLEMSETMKDGLRVFSAALEGDAPQALLFHTTHTRAEVLLDGESVYRFGWDGGGPSFLRSPGSLWHIVELPRADGTLQIRITPVYRDYYGNDIQVLSGSAGACVTELLWHMLPFLVVNCVIIFAGLLSLLLHCFTRSFRAKRQMGSFLYLGVFSLVIVVWSLCQCGFLQFLIPDSRTLYFVDFFSFYLFPIPFNLFVWSLYQSPYRKGFAALAVAYLCDMAVVLAIQMAGWADLFSTMFITHALMAVNVAYVFFAIHQEIRLTGSEIARRFRLPLYVVMLFALAELTVYYINGFRETSVFLPLGTIAFIAMLVWIQVGQYYRTMLEEQKLAYFEKLANLDILTEALNRNAYENTLKRLERQENEVRATGVILFDINDMKRINDHFGHEKGDEALKRCYHCIREAFGPEGECFRIGGDEFVYLTTHKQDLAASAARFQQLIRQESRSLDFPFSVACGYAAYEPGSDQTIRDVIRRSDAMMYAAKRQAHGEEFFQSGMADSVRMQTL